MRIVVIGSGFGGLSAALRLCAQGHSVTVIEKRDKPGGRAYVYEQDGFVFDAGPTIVTAPWLIDELFKACGKRTEDYIELQKLSPFYNVRFEDGSVFAYSDDHEDILRQIRRFNPADEAGYIKLRKKIDRIYEAGFALIDKPFLRFTDMIRVAPKLMTLRSDMSVADLVCRYIKDDRLRQVFSFHPLLIGGNPFKSTSIYALIHKLEQESGVWFAKGGTGALVQALAKLLTDSGGKIRYATAAKQIIIDPLTKKASGVLTEAGEVLDADAVVSNADIATTYMHMIAPEYRRKMSDRKIKSMNYSMSLFVLYFGTNRRYDNMAHHEILMGPRYRELLTDIFDRKVLADDFSLYLHRPTATDPSLAPAGCDSWYVLSPVPNLRGSTDWKTTAKVYRDKIVKYLESRYMPGLSQHIVTETYIDPLYFRDQLSSYLGNAFSVSPTLLQSAWFRPHNRSQNVENLYFAGAGTHPGAGIPGVIASGKIVSDLIAASIN